jgi:hypothetical protein
LKSVGREGAGNPEAMRAWKELATLGPATLPTVLDGLGDASPLAANWIRAAYETIADRAIAASDPRLAPMLEGFVRDRRHTGRARRLAYETLVRVDPSTPERLLPGMLDDPGNEMRRDAVDVVLKDAQTQLDAKNNDAARDAYRRALVHARERDQVQLIADRLKKLGVDVDLVQHFGFVTHWWLIGPFDSTGGIGFKTPYPPEVAFDARADLAGKNGEKVAWRTHETKQRLGIVDFNQAIAPLHGVVAYAYAVVDSPAERAVEVRAGSNNAVRIWLNGREVYFREEYHHGMQMDQHVGKATLRAGRNELLVKVCQNEQTDAWAQQWSFQLRLCDSLGGAVPFTIVDPAAK